MSAFVFIYVQIGWFRNDLLSCGSDLFYFLSLSELSCRFIVNITTVERRLVCCDLNSDVLAGEPGMGCVN